MTNESPFSLHRFEFQQQNLYFLPHDAFRILEDAKSTFLIGSRGTGKTTLLHALHWKEQLNNDSLRAHLPGSIPDRRYLGVYLRVPAMHVPAFDRWAISEEKGFIGSVFSAYLDLTWLEDLCIGIGELLDRNILRAKPREEQMLVGDICGRHNELISPYGSTPATLRKLAEVLYSKRREVERLAIANARITTESFSARFPLLQIGELGRSIASPLAAFCQKHSRHHGQAPWTFKVCFDEAECLSEIQQLTMNTMVRLGQAPLSYIVSYVRPMEQMSNTLLPNLTLQTADRNMLRLDELGHGEFRELAEGVASVRITHLKKEPVQYKLEASLGALAINRLLELIIKQSESKQAKELLTRAKELHDSPFGKHLKDEPESEPANDALPIYQAYLVDRLSIELPKPETPRWQRRGQDSAELRKRMVAAYLCICKELGQQVRYAFAEMVLQMSDKCIRDFLAQMHEIFVGKDTSIEGYLGSSVSIEVQNKALRKASKQKREFILASEVSSPRETLWLVDALGQLTARLQGGPESRRALRSSERGIFALKTSGWVANESVTRVIREAAEAGFLKIIKSSEEELQFRVHSSLAAAFDFSYRGSYYPVSIKAADLEAIYMEAEMSKRLEVIERLAAGMSGENLNLSLFEDNP
jgi:hypothetical protein